MKCLKFSVKRTVKPVCVITGLFGISTQLKASELFNCAQGDIVIIKCNSNTAFDLLVETPADSMKRLDDNRFAFLLPVNEESTITWDNNSEGIVFYETLLKEFLEKE